MLRGTHITVTPVCYKLILHVYGLSVSVYIAFMYPCMYVCVCMSLRAYVCTCVDTLWPDLQPPACFEAGWPVSKWVGAACFATLV